MLVGLTARQPTDAEAHPGTDWGTKAKPLAILNPLWSRLCCPLPTRQQGWMTDERWERLMPLVCPICKSPAQQLPSIDSATAFRCVIHHNFKVADAVWRDAEEYTREQWEIALRKAKQRVKPGQWPVIRRGDF
jgi:hypothetical protein